MKRSSAAFATAIVLGLAILAPAEASAQAVTVYVVPGYPGANYPANPRYSYAYPRYGYANPNYGYANPNYGYGRPYYGTYWGHSRRVARRVNRRWNRWR